MAKPPDKGTARKDRKTGIESVVPFDDALYKILAGPPQHEAQQPKKAPTTKPRV